MSKLLRLSLGGLFFLGCTAHGPRATPAGGESSLARPEPVQPHPQPSPEPVPPLQPPEWRAAAPSSLPPVLRKPTPKEGILVGSLTMPTKESSKSHCSWGDLRFRRTRLQADEPPLEASFIKSQPQRVQFHGDKEEGEIFHFTLPAGSYEIYYAVAVCIGPGNVRSRYKSNERFSFEFEVLPGKRNYLGELTFDPTLVSYIPGVLSADEVRFVMRNQWQRDGRLLESNYPLFDWSETAKSIQLLALKPVLEEAPLPRRHERLIAEPLTSGASQQEFEKACADGSGEGCFNLGLLVWKGRRLPSDERQAASLFARACERGIGQGCYNLGTFHLQSWAVKEPNLGSALQLFDKACKRGTAWGCLSLGKLYEEGAGTYGEQDPKKAVSIYQQSCQEGVAEGCFDLGMFYFKQKAVAGNKRQASSFFEQGCAKGYPRACFAAAQLQDE